MRIAGEAIELGNDELGAIGPAGLDCLGQLGTIVRFLAALDFDELLHQRPVAAVEEFGDDVALSLKAKAGFALPLSRHIHFPSAIAPSQINQPSLTLLSGDENGLSIPEIRAGEMAVA
jgi:hypothetical protein